MPLIPDAADNRYRLKQMILYIADRMKGAEFFGQTKLNKILYRAEFAAYRELGHMLTGYNYQKNFKGPTLRAFVPVTKEMVTEGLLAWEEHRQGPEGVELRADPQVKADLAPFQEAELAIIDREINSAWDLSGRGISDEEHRTAAWYATKTGETIRPQLAFVEDPDKQIPLSEAEEKRATRTYERRRARTDLSAGDRL